MGLEWVVLKSLGRGKIFPISFSDFSAGVLTELDLSYNKIGPTGATAIAEALRGSGVLTTLNLRYNDKTWVMRGRKRFTMR